MCDVSNTKDIVEELLQVHYCFTQKVIDLPISSILSTVDCHLAVFTFQYLSTADFAMREELSLKAAILAEKFAPDLSW